MSIGFSNFALFIFRGIFGVWCCPFFLISVVGGLTPGASAPGKPPRGTPKTCYAHGEETRAEPGPTAAGAAHAATITGPASTTGSATGSPCRHTRHSSGPTTAPGTRRSRSPRPRWTAHRQQPPQHPPTVTTCTAHSPPPYTRPGSHRSPAQIDTATPHAPHSPRPPRTPHAPPTQIIPLYPHQHRPPATKPAPGPRWTISARIYVW